MSSGEFKPRYLLLEQRGEITVATLRISLLSEDINLEQFGHELFALVEQAGCRKLVVNLKEVQMVTSAGLGKMIALPQDAPVGGSGFILSSPARRGGGAADQPADHLPHRSSRHRGRYGGAGSCSRTGNLSGSHETGSDMGPVGHNVHPRPTSPRPTSPRPTSFEQSSCLI